MARRPDLSSDGGACVDTYWRVEQLDYILHPADWRAGRECRLFDFIVVSLATPRSV